MLEKFKFTHEEKKYLINWARNLKSESEGYKPDPKKVKDISHYLSVARGLYLGLEQSDISYCKHCKCCQCPQS